MKKTNSIINKFDAFATATSKAMGSTTAFTIAFLVILVWAVTGPIFDYSETWQLIINTGTTIITFLMVFLIQKAQNKDSLALQIKLNELIASSKFSSNSIVDIEDITEEEMEIIQKYYRHLSNLSKKDKNLQTSHSIDEANEKHKLKTKTVKPTAKAKPAPKKSTNQ
ncbi:low affinity Fe/Cu permease [Flavobacterium sp. 1]|uniref:low affinity iron permease family protein n=1 Tax=Flavobacterium sp. 1 TaxID=2035200 RepID=UPI000C244D60|nr:low affinity iron permease family protein [Flavobacterium sp. 1]PJJ08592.1 low affinity Fe/Cu permease [Flavobacterium sp. 1]